MRTIKFRGKTLGTNAWVFGNLIQYENRSPEIVNKYKFVVKSDTVGQFTGLLDKNGKEIYEGDIVQSVRYKDFVYKVAYDQRFASFCLDREQDMYKHYFGEAVEAENCEVIGNIHDNPELLKNND